MGGTTTAIQELKAEEICFATIHSATPEKLWSQGGQAAEACFGSAQGFTTQHQEEAGQQRGESAIHCHSLFCSSLSRHVGFLVRQVCGQLLSQANFSGNHSPWTWEDASKQANATCPVVEVGQRGVRFLR